MSDTNQQTIDAYEQSVEAYISNSSQTVSEELKAWIDDGISRLERSAKILEIGTATGKDADYIEAQGFQVERSDATRAFVELQRSKGHETKVLNLLHDTIDTGYDLIFADAVLLHFTEAELESALAKVYDALGTVGYFMFSLKVGAGEEETDRKLGIPRYFHYWQADEIREKLAKVGFVGTSITVHDDYRGNEKPAWLFITTTKKEATA